LFASSGISARALLGSSAGFTLPYFELAERGCVLALSGTTTPTLLLPAEQLGSTAITTKIVVRIAVRLITTLNPSGALRTSNQDTRWKIATENPAQVCGSQSAAGCSRPSTLMRRALR
jgi:hypothetical protein